MERNDVMDDMCRIIQDDNDTFDWVRGNGRTPSGSSFDRRIDNNLFPVTGPNAAEKGQYYYFIEATGLQGRKIAR